MDRLKIGDPWPFETRRGLTGKPLAQPVWFALVVAPQKEQRVAEQLRNAGVSVEYPVDTRVRHHNGKKHEYSVPMISRIIYAQFDYAPQWDVLKSRRIITGVFCEGTRPIAIRDDIVRRICNLPEIEDEMERARIKAMTPEVGERIELRGDLFKGFRVDVTRTDQGRVWYTAVTGVGTLSGSAELSEIHRLARGGLK